jgi:hypothetical protein
MAAPLGFRVLGGAENRREVVSYRKSTTAYAHAHPAIRPELPAYLSAFAFPATFADHVVASGSTAGYIGPVGVPMLNSDIDRGDLDAALCDTRRLSHYLADRYTLDAADLLIHFSGSKGFHVSVPTANLVEPAPDGHQVAKALATRLADEVGVGIDTGVYDRVRLWRAPNSRHPKTGLHKVRIDLDDLLYIDPAGVRRLAVEPVPYDPPAPPMPPVRLVADWHEAAQQVARQGTERRERRMPAGTDRRINPLTRLLLSDPTALQVGERHKTVFSAAANLAEFETIDDLIAALLTPPALDTGLPPHEVERQIRCGIDHARRQNGEGGAR